MSAEPPEAAEEDVSTLIESLLDLEGLFVASVSPALLVIGFHAARRAGCQFVPRS
jgi:hypothetical protein